jgi:hypothetical protein
MVSDLVWVLLLVILSERVWEIMSGPWWEPVLGYASDVEWDVVLEMVLVRVLDCVSD